MRGSNLSQVQKIVSLMCKRKDSQEWFIPSDFMDPQLDYLFVGYEASARFSELAKKYPDMVQSMPAGKYTKRRIRWETVDQWFSGLPKDLRHAFHRSGVTKEVKQFDTPEPVREPSQPTRLFDIPTKPKRNIM